jgi:hypothetical protein
MASPGTELTQPQLDRLNNVDRSWRHFDEVAGRQDRRLSTTASLSHGGAAAADTATCASGTPLRQFRSTSGGTDQSGASEPALTTSSGYGFSTMLVSAPDSAPVAAVLEVNTSHDIEGIMTTLPSD